MLIKLSLFSYSRHASSHGGVFALSGECEYRCASLDACIAAALWCDGIPHCPRGEDERLAHCSALLRVPAHYAVMFLALTVLAAFAVVSPLNNLTLLTA